MASTTNRNIPLAKEPDTKTGESRPSTTARHHTSVCDWASGPYIVDPAAPDPCLTGIRLARRRGPHQRRNAVNIFAVGLRETAVNAADKYIAKDVSTGREGKIAGLRKSSLAHKAAAEAARKSQDRLWEALKGISCMNTTVEEAADDEVAEKGRQLFRASFKDTMKAITTAAEMERQEESKGKAMEDLVLEVWAKHAGVKLR